MNIVGAEAGHVAYVAANMRQRDLDEFLAVSHAETREQLAEQLVARFGSIRDGYCALADDDTPIAVGAMVSHRPNVATLFFFATDRFPEIAKPLTRFIRQRLFPVYREAGFHRFECVVPWTATSAIEWLWTLGLQEETVLPGYGKNGENYLQMAWIRDDLCPLASRTRYRHGSRVRAGKLDRDEASRYVQRAASA